MNATQDALLQEIEAVLLRDREELAELQRFTATSPSLHWLWSRKQKKLEFTTKHLGLLAQALRVDNKDQMIEQSEHLVVHYAKKATGFMRFLRYVITIAAYDPMSAGRKYDYANNLYDLACKVRDFALLDSGLDDPTTS